MAMLTVTVVRRDHEDREIVCRVTDADVTRWLEAQGDFDAGEQRRERVREQIARDRAAVRLFGKGVYWGGSVPGAHWRGQVWRPSRQGFGANAVTMEITMRVESR